MGRRAPLFTSVTGVEPALTAAVNVTAFPEAEFVTGLPPEVIVSVVFVAGFDCARERFPPPHRTSKETRYQNQVFIEPPRPKRGPEARVAGSAYPGLMIMAMSLDSSSTRTRITFGARFPNRGHYDHNI